MNEMINTIEKLENGRAAYAFSTVESYINKNKSKKENQKNYRSYIKKLPSIIQVNGLGQAMAFYYSKKSIHKDIYDQIDEWIKKVFPEKGDQEFINWLINQDSMKYRQVTFEVLALLNWMRRFVEGMVDGEETT